MDACSMGKSKNRSTVAAIILGALCIDTNGVRVVYVSVERRIISQGKNSKESPTTYSCSS